VKLVKDSVIRWFLSVALLVPVWLRAHWSVALSLTLIFIGMELHAHVISKLVDAVKLVARKVP
jgi:hypothetical protein